MRYAMYLTATVAAALSAVSAAQADRTWIVQPGTVICPTPFSMRDALAAAERDDNQWLRETGCERLLKGSQIVILENPPLSDSRSWRVRLLNPGRTVYVHSAFIMGYASIKGKRIGPLSYYKVYQMEADPPTSPQNSIPLTTSEIEDVRKQISRCWNVPAGLRDTHDLVIRLRGTVAPDGRVLQVDIIDQDRLSEPLFRSAAESARRALFHPLCTPLHLPANKYNSWKTFEIALSPKDIS